MSSAMHQPEQERINSGCIGYLRHAGQVVYTRIKELWALLVALAVTLVYSVKVLYAVRRRSGNDPSAISRSLIIAWCQKLMAIFQIQMEVIWLDGSFKHGDGVPDNASSELPPPLTPPSSSPARNYIIMSNHASHLDIPLLFLTFMTQPLLMVAKKELFQIPFFGQAMRESGLCLELDRQAGGRAMKALQQAIPLLKRGQWIWIAPEGGRLRNSNPNRPSSTTAQLGKFKRGGFWLAQQASALIVPVTIIGSQRILPAEDWLPRLQQKVRIVVGPLIDSTDPAYAQSMPTADGPRQPGKIEPETQLMDAVRQQLLQHLKQYPL